MAVHSQEMMLASQGKAPLDLRMNNLMSSLYALLIVK